MSLYCLVDKQAVECTLYSSRPLDPDGIEQIRLRLCGNSNRLCSASVSASSSRLSTKACNRHTASKQPHTIQTHCRQAGHTQEIALQGSTVDSWSGLATLHSNLQAHARCGWVDLDHRLTAHNAPMKAPRQNSVFWWREQSKGDLVQVSPEPHPFFSCSNRG